MTTVDLPRIPRTVPDWHAQGACQIFPELDWVEAKGVEALACRVICAACPVRELCARDALERGEPWGIWGGLDRTDRKAVALSHGFPRPAVLPPHGTNARYAKHRCGCADCRQAHTEYESERRARKRDEARRAARWQPEVLDRRTRVGRQWVGAGQLMLPLGAIPRQTRRTPSKPRALALVA